MSISSNAFNERVRDRILDLVWRQWVAIGVPGYARTEETHVVDPEALLVLTLTVGRHDARLFDVALAWLHRNGDLVNIQRLRSLLQHSPPEALAAMGATAELLGRKSTSAQKWKQLAVLPGLSRETPLFFQRDGRPMPTPETCDEVFQRHGLLRHPLPATSTSGRFPRDGAPSLLLRLRALLGVSLRCEVLCLLGANDELHPSRMAGLIGTAPRTMQKLLGEMVLSGFVQARTDARQKFYALVPGPLDGLLRPDTRTPWRNSVPLFQALERIWSAVMSPERDDLGPLVASSQWRRLAREIRPLLAEAGLGQPLREDTAHPGESYLRIFEEDIEGILTGL